MPKQQKLKEKKPKQLTITDEALNAHIKSLGLTSVREYIDWCGIHGFTRSTNKDYDRRKAELEVIRRKKADKALKEGKQKFKNPENVILDYLDGKNIVLPFHASSLCHELNKSILWKCENEFKKIIKHLLTFENVLFEKVHNNSTFLDAIVKIAAHHDYWLRPLEDWKPTSHNIGRQYSSLLRHLFCKYDVPKFMDKVWFKDCTGDFGRGRIHFDWYIHLGLGQNIRTAQGLPIPMTKMMAHHFCKAPEKYDVIEAIRWGQVHALGGDARISKALIGTKLATFNNHEDFWETVIRWFIANPMLDVAHYGPIIDYLQNQRFENYAVFEHGVARNLGIPQPNLSMKKRDPEALLKAVEAWHKKLGKEKKAGANAWAPSGFAGFRIAEGEEGKHNSKLWTITEYLSSKELIDEGRIMKHCVSSYARSCESGKTSIWSLRQHTNEGIERLLTIEVWNSEKRVVQVRGKLNRICTTREAKIINRWIGNAGLNWRGGPNV